MRGRGWGGRKRGVGGDGEVGRRGGGRKRGGDGEEMKEKGRGEGRNMK